MLVLAPGIGGHVNCRLGDVASCVPVFLRNMYVFDMQLWEMCLCVCLCEGASRGPRNGSR